MGGLAARSVSPASPSSAYYHHIFPQDHETRDLIDRLGLSTSSSGARGPWPSCTTAGPSRSTARSTFSASPRSRRSPAIRLAAATGVQLFRPDRPASTGRRCPIDGPRWFGRRGYDTLWRPLLEAKFGEHANAIPMAWLVARIRQRGGARKATGDRLGYLRGGLGTLAQA